jgi:hypothetical protein
MRVPVSHICQTGVVPEFCTCGAQLPPDARFCHKCGKPQYDYPGVEQSETPPPLIEVASVPQAPHVQVSGEISFHNRLAVRVGLISAVAAVLVSVVPLPFIFLRFLAYLAGGFLAVYLYSRRSGQILSMRSGARMGWITGIIAFAIVGVLAAVFIIAILSQPELAKQIQSQLPANDAGSSSIAEALNDPTKFSVELVQSLGVSFVLLTALPIIGGVLGAKVLEKE